MGMPALTPGKNFTWELFDGSAQTGTVRKSLMELCGVMDKIIAALPAGQTFHLRHHLHPPKTYGRDILQDHAAGRAAIFIVTENNVPISAETLLYSLPNIPGAQLTGIGHDEVRLLLVKLSEDEQLAHAREGGRREGYEQGVKDATATAMGGFSEVKTRAFNEGAEAVWASLYEAIGSSPEEFGHELFLEWVAQCAAPAPVEEPAPAAPPEPEPEVKDAPTPTPGAPVVSAALQQRRAQQTKR